ncbi:glutamic-type intramembrane protease PrsW [Paenibacillus glacialis]|uniref:Protease PrsW n=1 Tax=Paenibacillus glacialis TaxID=494026 RepID=A0A168M5Q4_9BACL|nr:glutamic-type intramembrane protease PrsW [Paenibacillus glacialis]OAB44255.1 peptidase [Paenibacillus glacialis]
MLLFSVIASAVAPGIALLTFFYLKDKYDAEPIHMVLRIFLLGLLIVIPVMIIQRGLTLGLGDSPFVQSFFISAGVEELLKWIVLYYIIYNHVEFDEPYDGIVYAVTVSLGFATVENVMYAWYSHASIGTMFIRALLPVSGHALFGVIMGYYFGRARFSKGVRTKRFLVYSLLIPLLFHGTYDLILTTVTDYWLLLMIPLMTILWYGGMGKVTRANSRSPFRFLKREEEVNT